MERVRKGRNEAWAERGKEGREEASGGERSEEGREQRREGEEQEREEGMSEGGREQYREGNFKGGTLRRTLATIQCTAQLPTRPLPLILWYYK